MFYNMIRNSPEWFIEKLYVGINGYKNSITDKKINIREKIYLKPTITKKNETHSQLKKKL